MKLALRITFFQTLAIIVVSFIGGFALQAVIGGTLKERDIAQATHTTRLVLNMMDAYRQEVESNCTDDGDLRPGSIPGSGAWMSSRRPRLAAQELAGLDARRQGRQWPV